MTALSNIPVGVVTVRSASSLTVHIQNPETGANQPIELLAGINNVYDEAVLMGVMDHPMIDSMVDLQLLSIDDFRSAKVIEDNTVGLQAQESPLSDSETGLMPLTDVVDGKAQQRTAPKAKVTK